MDKRCDCTLRGDNAYTVVPDDDCPVHGEPTQKVESPTTMTEVMILEYAKYAAKMNWEMAKALVEGKVDSRVLRYAEQEYETQKDIFEVNS